MTMMMSKLKVRLKSKTGFTVEKKGGAKLPLRASHPCRHKQCAPVTSSTLTHPEPRESRMDSLVSPPMRNRKEGLGLIHHVTRHRCTRESWTPHQYWYAQLFGLSVFSKMLTRSSRSSSISFILPPSKLNRAPSSPLSDVTSLFELLHKFRSILF